MRKSMLVMATVSLLSLPSYADWDVSIQGEGKNRLYQAFSLSKSKSEILLASVHKSRNCRGHGFTLTHAYNGGEFQTKSTCQLVADGKLIRESECHVLGLPSQGQAVLMFPSSSPLPIFNDDGQMQLKDIKELQFGLKDQGSLYTFDAKTFHKKLYQAYTACMTGK